MVDLMGQYSKIKNEIDRNIISSIESGRFVNGPIVKEFSENLSDYLNVKNVIPCANGTDALQIAFMALDLKPGDEIICPSWTYIATAEAAAILGIKIVFCDVDLETFNSTADLIEPHINDKTKAIVPVHLYGQSCDMAPIIKLAKKYNLKIIEDNAQAIGCKYTFPNGDIKFTGTLGHIGTTSFYPSKNLGCYGDGGAIFTNDDTLAEKIRMIVNHGVGQAKLIRVISGSVLDIVVDVRFGSPTFGKHISIELSSKNKKQIFIPRGFAPWFVVLSDEAVFLYKVDNYYNPESERGLAFDDKELALIGK